MGKPKDWIDHLLPIMYEYMQWTHKLGESDYEPMDGDDVEDLCNIIKAKINLHQGNITEEEYRRALDVPDLVEGTFTSIWDSGDSVSTKCIYDRTTNSIMDVEISPNEPPTGALIREFITIDGEEITVCMLCHEGLLESKMVPHPVNKDDHTLYEVQICSACREEA